MSPSASVATRARSSPKRAESNAAHAKCGRSSSSRAIVARLPGAHLESALDVERQ
jgi:hypothetical protein